MFVFLQDLPAHYTAGLFSCVFFLLLFQTGGCYSLLTPDCVLKLRSDFLSFFAEYKHFILKKKKKMEGKGREKYNYTICDRGQQFCFWQQFQEVQNVGWTFPGNSNFTYLILTAEMAIFVKYFSICHFSLTVRTQLRCFDLTSCTTYCH